ncbi:holliday junction resolvasome, helicase subunit [Pseudomonas sp. PIC25]|uniref:DUF2388 domain-containing protein n=1 Tax=Pseudomonas sp. PIC25 TaxID=1958773 RepID=UPI000BAB710A|nr:DUF2388 domain-containing protein [Pseudomonas sp. PIC25]PAU60673.1 holliday junction resolvasome, helicase subunit [Pseudomonas sp. PIC25]
MAAFRLFSAATLLALSTAASASSFIVTTDTVVGALGESLQASTDMTSSLRDDKVVLAAREDAASFVASQGEIRGARLEAALTHIREQAPHLAASDLQLAQAILAL